jgi:putative ABC transport system substrate-binding protein
MRVGRTRLIVALTLGLLARSLSADPQQPTRVPRIGILSDYSPSVATKSLEPFVHGLRDLGYIDGQNIAFEYRHGAENSEILQSLAAELVRLKPQVILAVGTAAAQAAKRATDTIPIVFTRVADPIGSGLIAALARPGGNLTGVTGQQRELTAKRLELLSMAVPGAKRVAVLWDPSFPTAGPDLREIEEAARSLNLELVAAEARAPDDFEPALRAILEQHAGALIVVGAVIFFEHAQQLADLTAKSRMPASFYRREFVEVGGLMSYASNYPDNFRHAAVYVDKILNGAKPTDLPVEQPTKFELVINLKTAKSLGLTIPPLLLGRADEVIE